MLLPLSGTLAEGIHGMHCTGEGERSQVFEKEAEEEQIRDVGTHPAM